MNQFFKKAREIVEEKEKDNRCQKGAVCAWKYDGELYETLDERCEAEAYNDKRILLYELFTPYGPTKRWAKIEDIPRLLKDVVEFYERVEEIKKEVLEG